LGLDTWNRLFVSDYLSSLEKLILIGDTDQIEPVGKGTVFWNLLTNRHSKGSVITLDFLNPPESEFGITNIARKLSNGNGTLETNNNFELSFIGEDKTKWGERIRDFAKGFLKVNKLC